MILIQFAVCMIATLCFAILFAAPRSELPFCGAIGAFGWVCYLACPALHISPTLANLFATFALALGARLIATLRKNPVTVYLIAGIFPLVPGAGIYYTSYYFIMNETSGYVSYGIQTVKVAGAIVLGIVAGFAPPQSWFDAAARFWDRLRRGCP